MYIHKAYHLVSLEFDYETLESCILKKEIVVENSHVYQVMFPKKGKNASSYQCLT